MVKIIVPLNSNQISKSYVIPATSPRAMPGISLKRLLEAKEFHQNPLRLSVSQNPTRLFRQLIEDLSDLRRDHHGAPFLSVPVF